MSVCTLGFLCICFRFRVGRNQRQILLQVCCKRLNRRVSHILIHLLVFRQPVGKQMLLSCGQDDFVVHVGDVHDKVHVKLEVVLQNAANDIGRNIVAGMA